MTTCLTQPPFHGVKRGSITCITLSLDPTFALAHGSLFMLCGKGCIKAARVSRNSLQYFESLQTWDGELLSISGEIQQINVLYVVL